MTDLTAEINARVNAAPDGSTLELPAGPLNGTILVDGKHGLTLRGTGELYAGPSVNKWRSQIRIQGGADIRLENVTLNGGYLKAGQPGSYNANLEGQHGVAAFGVQGLTVTNSVIHHTTADFLYLSRREDNHDWCKDVLVTGCYLHHGGRQGVTQQGVAFSTVRANIIHDTARSLFEFEPSTNAFNGANDIELTDNWIGPSRLGFVSAAGRGAVIRVGVRRNRLFGKSMDIIIRDLDGARRSDWTIEDNASDQPCGNPSQGAVQAWRVDRLSIRNNVQPMSRREDVTRPMFMAALHDCPAAIVTGNQGGPYMVGQAIALPV